MARWWRPEICSRQAGQVAEKVILLALNFVHLIRADPSEFCRKQMWLPFQSLPDFRNQKWCIYGRYHDWFYGWWICLENEWKWIRCDCFICTTRRNLRQWGTIVSKWKNPTVIPKALWWAWKWAAVWLGTVANVTEKLNMGFDTHSRPRTTTLDHGHPHQKQW